MKKIKVLITGVNGFIGQHVAKRLLKEGYKVHGLYFRGIHRSTTGEVPKNKNVIPHWGDLLDFERIGKIVKSIKQKKLLHYFH